MATDAGPTVSYDQFCPVATSIDALGSRWSLLLMRDLLWAGPQSRQGLIEHNPGLTEEALDGALERLSSHGLIDRLDEPKARYTLTDRGEGISDVIHALFTFGLPLLEETAINDWMLEYAIADCSRRRRFDLLEVEQRSIVRVVVDQADLCVELSPGLLRVVDGHEPDATLTMSARSLARLLAGSSCAMELLNDGSIVLEGDLEAGQTLLAILPADH